MDIDVRYEDGETYAVSVGDGGRTRTTHRVDVSVEMLERYAAGSSAEDLLRESFVFLLEREPPESILRQFAIEVIERYFPEYPGEIRRRLSA